MKRLTLLMASTLCVVAGCGGGDEGADSGRTSPVTVGDNITRQVSACPPELKEALEAGRVEIAGVGPPECAPAVAADKVPPRGEAEPAEVPLPPETKGPITATVAFWYDEKGWGSVNSPAAPGGIFVHFSAIKGKGYRSLRKGQKVVVLYTKAVPGGQDGNAWVAERVAPLD